MFRYMPGRGGEALPGPAAVSTSRTPRQRRLERFREYSRIAASAKTRVAFTTGTEARCGLKAREISVQPSTMTCTLSSPRPGWP